MLMFSTRTRDDTALIARNSSSAKSMVSKVSTKKPPNPERLVRFLSGCFSGVISVL